MRSTKFPWLIYWAIVILIGLFTLAPIASVFVAGWVSSSHACKVDEGSAHPCIINGHDYGELLYTLGVMGWLMLLTLPAGALAFAAWLAALILHRASWRKKQPL